MEELSEDERRALRGSKFAPLPSLSPSSSTRSQPRLAHPGGPLKTNKAAALAKFLERKLQDPNGLASINPQLVELAVKNAREAVLSSGTSGSGKMIQHVDYFEDPGVCGSSGEGEVGDSELQKTKKGKTKKKKEEKKKKKKKKNKKHKASIDENAIGKRPKKKLKL